MVANTASYDGSSFTEVADLSTARSSGSSGKAGGDTSASGLLAAGTSPGAPYTTNSEEWTIPSTTFTKKIDGQLYFNSTSNAFKVT